MKIYQNLWAGKETYFIPLTHNNEVTSGYSVVNVDGIWNLYKGNFYNDDLKNDTEHFPIIGELDFNQLLINEILQILQKNKKEQQDLYDNIE